MLLVATVAATSVSSTLDNRNSSTEVSEQFNFAKSHHRHQGDLDDSDHGDTHDDGNDDNDEFVLINVTEFVARVRGGIKQAKRIAKKYNLKLIRRVSDQS